MSSGENQSRRRRSASHTSRKSSRQLSLSRGVYFSLRESVRAGVYECSGREGLKIEEQRAAAYSCTHTPTGRPVIKSNLPCNAETVRRSFAYQNDISTAAAFQPGARVPANSLTQDRRGDYKVEASAESAALSLSDGHFSKLVASA